MKSFFCFLAISCCYISHSQNPIYSDEFNTSIFSVGNAPTGYTFENTEENWHITGTGVAEAWTAFTYGFHTENGSATQINAAANPKLYIRVKGTNSPELRIDFQDVSGYVTNQNPTSVNLESNYKTYEFDFTNKLADGGYGGSCTDAPCTVDASKISSLVFFVNPGSGGFSGTIDIDWISIGEPLEADESSSEFDIRYNQVAYLTGREKLINIFSSSYMIASPFHVINSNGETVLEGNSTNARYWAENKEYVAIIDVTTINDPGEYTLIREDKEVVFNVANNYGQLTEASLKYYYYNRASTAISEEYGGKFKRASGHPDDQVLIHSSAASANRPTGTVISAPKGWYDAGDYNKYIVNSGISTYTLLAAYEHYPQYYQTHSLNIPEKGGDLPDILDEVLWNLDWMLAMQDPNDGGVYHKLTGLNFSGEVMPKDYNLQRYVVQKTTAAALNFAAVTAVASRVFRDFETEKPGFSTALLDASEKAYAWAKQNPTVYYQQPNDVQTGGYGDTNVADEFRWAAAELFITIKHGYYNRDNPYYDDFAISYIQNSIPGWSNVDFLALISLYANKFHVETDLNVNTVKSKILEAAYTIKERVETSPMKITMSSSDYFWGSNGQTGNQLMLLIIAYEISREQDFLDAAFTGVDYLLGRNGTGYSYVTGFGNKPPMHPHHRISQADGITDPIPGMVVGGPNSGQQDNCTYTSDNPASSYLDAMCSYASNEVTINWNAPFAYVINALAYYQENGTGLSIQEEKQNNSKLQLYPNPVDDSLFIFPNRYSEESYVIYDLSGKKVQEGIVESGKLPVKQLVSGIYFFKLTNHNSIKFIKN